MIPLKVIRGVIDRSDLAYVRSLGKHPVLAEPAPIGGAGVINPHSTRFYAIDGTITDVFHIKPIYYEAIDHTWRPMSEVAVHHGNHNIVLRMGWGRMMSQRYFQWLIKRQRLLGRELAIEGLVLQPAHYEFAAYNEFYPDPNTETTTVDGYVQASDNNFSTCRSLASANVGTDDSANHYYFQVTDGGAPYYITRDILLFDATVVDDTDEITDAVLSVFYWNGTKEFGDSGVLHAVSSNPASNTAIVAGDYDLSRWGSTSFGSSAISGFTNDTYINLTFNASGIAAVSTSVVTDLGLRVSLDIDNSAPTGTNQAAVRSADYTNTTTDPRLALTHVPGGPTNFLLLEGTRAYILNENGTDAIGIDN